MCSWWKSSKMANQWRAAVFVRKGLKKNQRNMVNAPFTPSTPPLSWLRVRHPQLMSAPQKEDVEISIKNVTLQLKVRSGRIYWILAANRLIGNNCLLFTQKFLLHVNKSPSLPRTHTISALSIQEFQLLDISPLPQHLSLVNTVIK